ncbi:hypothetical protein RND71_002711 [Anisodus tanguticus]|uniref:Protein kinase domain-containing protein n=2 Tax=Anisodus tanguticus TaxID=243964 RepID=A0AAE1SV96_9SOLA|nr:hypothetical protein RND71_002711 [Anisodus tanguticus]
MSGCDAKPFPRIRLLPEGDWYYALEKHNSSVWLGDPKLATTLRQHKCQAFNKNFSLPSSPSISFNMINLNKFFKCNSTRNNTLHIIQKKNDHFSGYNMYNGCEGFSIYYKLSQDDDEHIGAVPTNCSLIRLPIHSSDDAKTTTSSSNQRKETAGRNTVERLRHRHGLLTSLPVFGGVGSVMITCLVVNCIWHYKKRKFSSSHLLSTKKLSDNFNHDVEGGSIYFGVPVFSYSELEEATNDFNSSRELGDGGYGTVYYGKLKDGREVAVKRLHEHNCKRMQQFVNEIEILTRLRHNNLVTLYGCTSRRGRELLLVYDYIPNGTLADHLHGDKAKDRSLAWPIRMNIAIETAGALAYLHVSDVIHCDVKTNNILLDHNFSVKVADFGISRLFPNDVSHISTAPRGPLVISIQSITNVTS